MAKTPKWNGEQGSSDMEKDPLRKDTSGLGYSKPVDISRVVDSNHAKKDGFAAPLKPSRED
jgi:hypothetical protein